MSATLTVYSISSRPLCAAAEGAKRTFMQQARHQVRVRHPIRAVRLKGTVSMSVLLSRVSRVIQPDRKAPLAALARQPRSGYRGSEADYAT